MKMTMRHRHLHRLPRINYFFVTLCQISLLLIIVPTRPLNSTTATVVHTESRESNATVILKQRGTTINGELQIIKYRCTRTNRQSMIAWVVKPNLNARSHENSRTLKNWSRRRISRKLDRCAPETHAPWRSPWFCAIATPTTVNEINRANPCF